MAENYKVFTKKYKGENYRIIKTKASNIKSEIINKPVTDTNYYGINGGFFNSSSYYSAPIDGVVISWNKGANDNRELNSGNLSENYNRGVFFTYKDGGKIKAGITRAKSVSDLRNKVGNIDFQTIIGGGSLVLGSSKEQFEKVFENEHWDCSTDYLPIAWDARRTALGFQVEDNEWYAYLIVNTEISGCDLYEFRTFIKDSLGCYDAINLDGAGSTQMRVKDGSKLIEDSGSDPRPPFDTGRYVWNMVRLIKTW